MSTIAFTLAWNLGLATALALLVGLLSRWKMLRRRPALTHALWLLVLAKFVTPPLVPLPVLPSRSLEVEPHVANVALLRPLPGAAASASPSQRGASLPWFAMLLSISLAGTLVLAARSLWQLRRVSRILRHAPRDDAHLARLAQAAAFQIGVDRVPAVSVVEAPLSPYLWAAWSGPVVVLPKGLVEQMSDEEITCILCHELAHFARRDHWTSAFAFLVTLLFWWYPVTWWARRELRATQEICCDALVLAAGVASRHCYAKTLFQALEFVQPDRRLQPTWASAFGESSSLRRRFEMIADRTITQRFSWWAAGLVIAGGFALLCLPVRAQPKPQGSKAEDTPAPLIVIDTLDGTVKSNQLLVELTHERAQVGPMPGVQVVERAGLNFDALEAAVDPTKHCIYVGEAKPNARTGALRVDLERGATYTFKASGEAFMTSETGADADPFPGLVLYYPTDEEDCYAHRMAVLKPGETVTFKTPWMIKPQDEVYALAFFLAIPPGEHRGGYKLAITRSKSAVLERQFRGEGALFRLLDQIK